MARTSLAPGFRFHPTDVELVMYYLKRKLTGKKLHCEAISEVNVYDFGPWDLPDKSCLKSKDLEWFFFSPRQRKYANGGRSNRSTENGYWKTSGKDRTVTYCGRTVGMVKTLIFHLGHAPAGKRTDWVMHEYRMEDKDLTDAGTVQDAYVICKIFQKSGPGPKNGASYGAPFDEKEWDDDKDDEICIGSSPVFGLSSTPATATFQVSNHNFSASRSMDAAAVHVSNPSSSAATSMDLPGTMYGFSLTEPGPSMGQAGLPANEMPPDGLADDEIDAMLARFTDDSNLFSPEYQSNENLSNLIHVNSAGAVTCLNGNDIYNGLDDLVNFTDLSGAGFNNFNIQKAGYATDRTLLLEDAGGFVELNDLDNPLDLGYERIASDGSYAPSRCNEQLEQCGSNLSGTVQSASGSNTVHTPAEISKWRWEQ